MENINISKKLGLKLFEVLEEVMKKCTVRNWLFPLPFEELMSFKTNY